MHFLLIVRHEARNLKHIIVTCHYLTGGVNQLRIFPVVSNPFVYYVASRLDGSEVQDASRLLDSWYNSLIVNAALSGYMHTFFAQISVPCQSCMSSIFHALHVQTLQSVVILHDDCMACVT